MGNLTRRTAFGAAAAAAALGAGALRASVADDGSVELRALSEAVGKNTEKLERAVKANGPEIVTGERIEGTYDLSQPEKGMAITIIGEDGSRRDGGTIPILT